MIHDTTRVAVLAPMPSELKPFVRRARLRRSGDLFTGHIADHPVVAMTSGVGMGRAARAAERLLDAGDVDLLVVIGIAGGVDPSAAIGDVIVPEVVADGATGAEYRPAPCPGVVARGRIVTFDDFDEEMGAMGQLQRAGVTAVDMETAAVARVCEERGCPYWVFRAVSDNATDGSVDAATAGMLHADGTPDVGAALRYVARRPWRIPRLARLGRDSARASDAAARAAIAALRSGEGRAHAPD